jgi:hypothetical protein
MYFSRNWEFGLALSKLQNFGGGLNPPHPPHGTPLYVQQFMARKRKRCHPLHLHSCLDLDSCDLFLFPKMKLKFKDCIATVCAKLLQPNVNHFVIAHFVPLSFACLYYG